MNLGFAYPAESSNRCRLPLGRWAGLAALLILESSAIAFRLFGLPAPEKVQWIDQLLNHRYALLRLCIVTTTAILFFGGKKLRQQLERMFEQTPPPISWWPWYLGHLAAFTSCAALLSPVIEQDKRFFPFPGAGTMLLVLTGLMALVCWFKSVLPVRFWLRLLWREKPVFLAGLAIGAVALGAGWLTAERLGTMPRKATCVVVYKVLAATGAELKYEPASFLIGTPLYLAKISSSASGDQGLGLVLVFLGTYFWLFRHQLRFPHALVLLPVALLVVWLVNVLRIALLIEVGTRISPIVATEMLYSHFGWLVFNMILVGLLALANRTRWLTSGSRTASEKQLMCPPLDSVRAPTRDTAVSIDSLAVQDRPLAPALTLASKPK